MVLKVSFRSKSGGVFFGGSHIKRRSVFGIRMGDLHFCRELRRLDSHAFTSLLHDLLSVSAFPSSTRGRKQLKRQSGSEHEVSQAALV